MCSPIEVFYIGGHRDGEILDRFDTITDAVDYTRRFWRDHELEFNSTGGCVGIWDSERKTAIEW